MKITDLGRLVATRAVDDLKESNKKFNEFLKNCFVRYLNNDWGDLEEDDKQMNDNAGSQCNYDMMIISSMF